MGRSKTRETCKNRTFFDGGIDPCIVKPENLNDNNYKGYHGDGDGLLPRTFTLSFIVDCTYFFMGF